MKPMNDGAIDANFAEHFSAMLSDPDYRRPPTKREQLSGQNTLSSSAFIAQNPGNRVKGYDSRSPMPIGIEEMNAAKKAKDKRKARKKMRQQSRKKK